MSARRAATLADGVGKPGRSSMLGVLLMVVAALCCGVLGYLVQATHNRLDAEERFAVISHRVARQIVERMHRYEYGLRGARGVAVAADGRLTRAEFSRYAASRQIDREFPGARGFGIVLRVPEPAEQDFVRNRRELDSPDFSIRSLGAHDGDRFVITFVEPAARNREALGLDIGSESARRAAALASAASREATLTAPLTLVQASGSRSGGLLLLLPIHRPGPADGQFDQPREQLVGWSYAPLLIEEVLQGLDTEEDRYQLSLYDADHDAQRPFFTDRHAPDTGAGDLRPRVSIPIYGRRWEAALRPTPAFFASLHQPSPRSQGLFALLLGAAVAALIATVVQLNDRTRGHRLEQARRAAIVEGSADAIVVQTLSGTITDWNEGAERLFGYAKTEAKGRTATALLLPPALEAEDAAIRETVAQGGRVQVFETVRRARDGTLIPVSVTASPIRDDSGAVVGAAKILRDVRDAKATEQRMRDLNASLEEQVRERTGLLAEAMREAREANEAKSRFLANISHEIRTPMNAVIGMTHLLGKTRLDDEQTGMLNRVSTAGKTLLALLNDVLDLSKIEARQMVLETAPFRLQQVIGDIASIAAVSAEQRDIRFRLGSDAPDTLVVVGDRTRFGQVLLNLLTNAIKFTSHGSVALDIRTARPDDRGRLPITVTVTDTGIGIPQDVQQRLFQPFVQADTSTTRRFGGTGLGLSIVRQLVDLMGGAIALRSEPGVGSVFEIRIALPTAASALSAPVVAGHADRASTALAGRAILVVDDNALNREVAARILRASGAIVSMAANGQEAVTAVEGMVHDGARRLDAILMDVQMPVMDGLEATRRLRAMPGRSGGLPIIGLTAGVSSDERSAALAAGMNAVVGKPFDPEMLADTVAGHLTPGPVPGAAGDSPPAALPAPGPHLAAVDDWPGLALLDPHLSWRNLGGDRQMLRRMVQSLLKTLEDNAALLARHDEDPQAWLAHAAALHDFKSIAGTLGGRELQESASAAEQLIRQDRRQAAREPLLQLEQLGRRLQASVRLLLPEAVADGRGGAGDAGTPVRAVPFPLAEAGDLRLLMAHLADM